LREYGRVRALRAELLTLFAGYSAVPCTVFDPFAGSGTTLLVARRLGRNGVGLDLSLDYLKEQAGKRLGITAGQMWLGVDI